MQTKLTLALVGNPNSGKTTVFNSLTGSHQHVGNWPGVTVEHKEGFTTSNGVDFTIVDLPGVYSLSAYSQEEVVARNYLLDNPIDVIVNIVDAGNLERNLYLTTQLLELGKPVVVVLNMYDMAESLGQRIDLKLFAEMLGVRVVCAVASKGQGIEDILKTSLDIHNCQLCGPPRSARHNMEIEHEVAKLEDKIKLIDGCKIPLRWVLIKSLEGDIEAKKRLAECSQNAITAEAAVDSARKHMESLFRDDLDIIIADGRYGFIGGLLRETVTKPPPSNLPTITDKLDNVLLNRALGIPIFLVLMFLTFKLTFDVGGYFVNIIVHWVDLASHYFASSLPPGPLSSLIIDGVLAGVGGVVVFVPNIAVMFMVISFLEDSGYMARAAFIMDRTMHYLGLHGKSFIPMIMGFGCNVPAIMAARTLDTKEDRLITILINPLMSCTARLPIYILFTSVFFSEKGAWVIFSLYVLGILLAVTISKILRKTLFKNAASPFVMELPPYRLPTLKGTLMHVWERTSIFLTKAGTIILAVSIIIWALGSLPWGVTFGSENSFIGQFGKAIEPIVKPLGLEWRAAVALLFGIGSKEIVVSTLGVLCGSPGSSGTETIQGNIRAHFTPLTSYVFMVISLIYIPCVATIAAIRRETNSWKWTAFAIGYSLVLAYIVAFAVYKFGMIAGLK